MYTPKFQHYHPHQSICSCTIYACRHHLHILLEAYFLEAMEQEEVEQEQGRAGREGVRKDMKKCDTSTMDFVLQENRSNILVVAKETSREKNK